MEFIDKLVLPQSADRIVLLKNLLILGQVIFFIFSGTLLASAILSRSFLRKGQKSGNGIFYRLSVDFIDLIATNKLLPIGLGIVPMLGIVMIYIQLMHGTGTKLIEYMLFASGLYVLAIFFIYVYRSDLLKKFGFLSTDYEDVDNHDDKVSQLTIDNKAKSSFIAEAIGFLGVISLVVTIRIFSACIFISGDPASWSTDLSVWSLVLSPGSLILFLNLITISFALAGISTIIKLVFWDRNHIIDMNYFTYIGNFNTTISLIFSYISTFLFFLNTVLTPAASQSTISYIILASTLCISLIYILLLQYNKEDYSFKLSPYAFYGILIVFFLVVFKENDAFGLASRKNTGEMAASYLQLEETLHPAPLGEMGEKGKEIYNMKCQACHRFDQKLVGPPHKEVMKKYFSDKQAMIDFVLKPRKVDPAYPDMPAQGLTPKEAKAVVEFMFKEFGSKIQ
ncbi:MAG: Cytochrome c class [Ignavibacteria bacterium]|nr:Cytochrome c class [Ignavibacteria bacterium]